MSDPNTSLQLSTALMSAREDAKALGELGNTDAVLRLADRYAAFLLNDGVAAKVSDSIRRSTPAITKLVQEGIMNAFEKTDPPAA